MANIVRQVNLVKPHVSLSQHSTVQFEADSIISSEWHIPDLYADLVSASRKTRKCAL